MNDDYVEFEFAVPFGPDMPEWVANSEGHRGRASRAAIEKLFGPIAADVPLQQAFEQVELTIIEVARAKALKMGGDGVRRLTIDEDDVNKGSAAFRPS